MKTRILTLLFIAFASTISAQSFSNVWFHALGGQNTDYLDITRLDSSGNIYNIGSFEGTMDFDPGVGVYSLSSTSSTNPALYIQKLDNTGNFIWAKKFNNISSSGRFRIQDVIIDYSGNFYLLGYFDGIFHFGSQAIVGGSNCSFIAKLDSQGNPVWVQSWNITSFLARGFDMGPGGNLFLIGHFENTIDFDPSPSQTKFRTSNGGSDVFVIKLDTAGNVLKVRTAGGLDNDGGFSIQISAQGDVYIGGQFKLSGDFELGPGKDSIFSAGDLDAFVMKTDTGFSHKWVKSFGGSGLDRIWRMRVTDSNSLYLLGNFKSNSDLNPDPVQTSMHSSNGDVDVYLLKLDTAGSYIWARTFGGVGEDFPADLTINSLGEPFLLGQFEQTVDFDPSPNADQYRFAGNISDAFLLKLDAAGNFNNLATFSLFTNYSNFRNLLTLNLQSDHEIFVSGSFEGWFDADPSVNVNLAYLPNSSSSSDNIFYGLYTTCANGSITIQDDACGYYVLPNGVDTAFTSGLYQDTLVGSNGCDSTVDVQLTVMPDTVNKNIALLDSTLTSAASGVAYQWLNCNTMQPIAGETNQSLVLTSNGQYAVILTNGICIDTTACFAVTNLATENNKFSKVSLYPNPTSGLVQIESNQEVKLVEVFDLTGRKVFSKVAPTEQINLSTLQAGIYLVKLKMEEGVVVRRIVKRD